MRRVVSAGSCLSVSAGRSGPRVGAAKSARTPETASTSHARRAASEIRTTTPPPRRRLSITTVDAARAAAKLNGRFSRWITSTTTDVTSAEQGFVVSGTVYGRSQRNSAGRAISSSCARIVSLGSCAAKGSARTRSARPCAGAGTGWLGRTCISRRMASACAAPVSASGQRTGGSGTVSTRGYAPRAIVGRHD